MIISQIHVEFGLNSIIISQKWSSLNNLIIIYRSGREENEKEKKKEKKN